VKVLFLPSQYPTAADPVNAVFVREDALAAARVDAVSVLWVGMRPWRRGLRIVERELDGGVPTTRLLLPRVPLLGPLLVVVVGAIAAVVAARRLRPAVVHGHAALPGGLLAWIAARAAGAPLVLSEYMNPFTAYLRNPLRRAVVRRVFAFAAAVLVDSQFSRRQIEAAGVRAERFVVAPNAVDCSLFFPPADGRPDRPPLLLFAGRLADEKDPLLAVRVLARLPAEIELAVVGDGPLRAACEALARELGVSARVDFRGAGAKPAVAEAMREASLLLLPSRSDNQPAVLGEAACSGLPVVARAVGGVREFVDDGCGVVVESDDPAALADAVRTALERPFDAARLVAAGRARYGYDAVAQLLHGVYAAAARE
jgi:glycosyltransferase involved in cell wall biosynthesis